MYIWVGSLKVDQRCVQILVWNFFFVGTVWAWKNAGKRAAYS